METSNNIPKESWFVSTSKKYKAWKKNTYQKLFVHKVKVDLSEAQDGSDIHEINKPFPIGLVLGLAAIVALLVFSFLMMDIGNVKISWAGVWEKIHSMFSPSDSVLYGYGECIEGTQTMIKTIDEAGVAHYEVTCEGVLVGWDGWFAYMFKEAIPKIWQTFELCFVATIIGSVLAIPIYYLSASNIMKSAWIYQPVRILNNLIRTIPTLVLALFAELIFGINSVAGIVAMIFFTLGIMYKLMYEHIETLNMDPFEAIKSSGGRTLQCYSVTLHPEVKPMFFANIIYILEMNIRGSVILGYVGAGGIGYDIQELASQMRFDRIGAILVPLFIVVFALQLLSNTIARKLR